MKKTGLSLNAKSDLKPVLLLAILVIFCWSVVNLDMAAKRSELGVAADPDQVFNSDSLNFALLNSNSAPALIRFHVVANSDAEEDQALKRAVRDAILRKISPILALSESLEESRRILMELQPEMEQIAREVVAAWGHDDQVRSEYGRFQFPTKSYGSLVLPAGNYEAVRILIGKAEGSNWWCVLFPPLCIIDVDGDSDDHTASPPPHARTSASVAHDKVLQTEKTQGEKSSKTVKFYFWEKIKSLKENNK